MSTNPTQKQPQAAKTTRILLVEDHLPTRHEMRVLIEGQPNMTVVAEAVSGEDGMDLARSAHPDIVVMDILLPGINGIEATRRILVEHPDIKVLALSNHFGSSLVQAVRDSGGKGYVRKCNAFEELIPALQAISGGDQYFTP
jgi:DNA-binding NarL/FixJ family response regulator